MSKGNESELAKPEPTDGNQPSGTVIDTKEIAESVKLSDKKIEVSDNKDTDTLYNEFSDFLEIKADMVEDTGVKQIIPTPIDLLNAILGGGFAVGALHIIVGTPGSGKSMLAIQTMGSGQNAYDKFLASFMDSEEATTAQRLANLGVVRPKVRPYNDITIEKVFKHLETMCLFKEEKKIKDLPSMAVWDSIANTLSEKERNVEDINSVIGYKARLLSLLVPKYVARCSEYNICWIAVNQLRDQLQLTSFAPAKDLRFLSAGKSMPGGNVLKYNAFTLLEMKAKSVIDPDKMGFEGIISSIKTVKGKLFPPNIEIELVGDFVRGFSNFWTNYNFLAKTKRLQTGAWNYLKADPDKQKFRTKDAEDIYNTEERFKIEFDKAVKEAINTEVVQKYSPDIA